jgi:hypothetical protein
MSLGMESGRFERGPNPERTAVSAPEVQAALALLVYARKHGDQGINYRYPMKSDPKIRQLSMQDWMRTQNGESHAESFGRYRDEHQDEKVALGSRYDLLALMDHVSPGWEDEIRKAA